MNPYLNMKCVYNPRAVFTYPYRYIHMKNDYIDGKHISLLETNIGTRVYA